MPAGTLLVHSAIATGPQSHGAIAIRGLTVRASACPRSSMSLHRLLLSHCHFPCSSRSLPRFRGPGSDALASRGGASLAHDCSQLLGISPVHWFGRLGARSAGTESFGLQVRIYVLFCHASVIDGAGVLAN
jgi:hypothetical protein